MGRVDHLLNQPVTIVTRTTAGTNDRYGQPIVSEATTTVGGHVRQINTYDQFSQGSAVIEAIEVFLPAATVVDDFYAIEWDGNRYEVQGQPKRPFNPRTREPEYVSVLARAVSS